MHMNILIILGHPGTETFCEQLALSYQKGAEQAGATVKLLKLNELQFDLNLRGGYKKSMPLEPDLQHAQELISGAQHLVFVYPSWWGLMPALLKGFIDRTFLPGFAFKYRKDSPMWDKLLAGRSARLIVTMDAPPLYYWLMQGGGGHRAMKNSILKFCGIKPVKITSIGSIKSSTAQKREKWLAQVRQLGLQQR